MTTDLKEVHSNPHIQLSVDSFSTAYYGKSCAMRSVRTTSVRYKKNQPIHLLPPTDASGYYRRALVKYPYSYIEVLMLKVLRTPYIYRQQSECSSRSALQLLLL